MGKGGGANVGAGGSGGLGGSALLPGLIYSNNGRE